MTVSVMVVAHFLIWNSQGRPKTSFRPDLVKLRQNDVIAWLNEDFFTRRTGHRQGQRSGREMERSVNVSLPTIYCKKKL